VCDNCSTDGSREILADCANKGKLKLIVERSSRGRGREIAFENSTGAWILSGLDMDDVFKPTLRDILKLYHEKHEGYMLSFGTVHIIPRTVVEEVGGWRDLYWGEDVDFRKRVESISKWREVSSDSSPLVMKRGSTKRNAQLYKEIKEIYMVDQAKYRIGPPCNILQDIARKVWYKQLFLFFIATCAIIACRVKGLRKFEYNPSAYGVA